MIEILLGTEVPLTGLFVQQIGGAPIMAFKPVRDLFAVLGEHLALTGQLLKVIAQFWRGRHEQVGVLPEPVPPVAVERPATLRSG